MIYCNHCGHPWDETDKSDHAYKGVDWSTNTLIGPNKEHWLTDIYNCPCCNLFDKVNELYTHVFVKRDGQ